LRTWKEKIWGLGGDPRLALMMMQERDRIREEFYKPVIESRKNIRIAKRMISDRNQKIASNLR